MIKSLYFNWLRNLDKSLLMPELVFENIKEGSYSGSYFRPRHKTEIYIDQRAYPLDRGLIVITTEGADSGVLGEAEIMAHEWRHHWQQFNWPAQSSVKFDMSLSYPEAIRKFFRSSPKEKDALMFAHHRAPVELTEHWLEILSKESSDAQII